jgi:hypothetical protein
MSDNLPERFEVLRAVELYLKHAYESDFPPPRRVQGICDELREAGELAFFDLSIWECDSAHPPLHRCLRLGNRVYPHMKLTLERRPDGLGYVYRVDGHDQHVRQSLCGNGTNSTSSTGALLEFEQIVKEDAAIAAAIESAWERAGLPTLKRFLATHLDESLIHTKEA